MDSHHKTTSATFDQRDTLILALSALLRAERQTRQAFEACLAGGVLSPEILEAIVSDPIPVVTQEDLNYADSVAMNATHAGGNS
jgi:hypothetical protein